ncbi:hypothetical protein WA026_001346 [Henosepilachna vigintioctopunctata]|uniref:RNA (guanine-9-)-methyltransferase domain-containing protein 1 n=1 Tax=Henosepilachna vigintioctopunctata TaxID=420089 RepID=A0AAW1UK95_9CUCU
MHSLGKTLYKLCQWNTCGVLKIPPHINCPVFKQKLSACNFSTEAAQNEEYSILEEVCQGDKEIEHKLKVLMLEVELNRQEGHLVPENHEMKAKHYTELLKLNSRSKRKKYLEFLFKICRKEDNRKRKKEEKALEFQKKKETIPPKNIPFEQFVQTYSLQHNNFFLRIRDKTINNMFNNKLIQAMRFGQKLIIDCGYYNKMTDVENANCAKQIMMLFGDNRLAEDPFDLHLCNFNKNSNLAEMLQKKIDTLYNPEFPINIHEQSYLDLFPKRNLVYLTPHCKEEMQYYDHDALYIIGGIVDKMNQEPLSMAKAKQENLQMMKLPLDKYLLWTGGSGKSLTLNQVLNILIDVKNTGNWEYAFRHVPRRKLMKMEENEIENVRNDLIRQKQKWTPNLENVHRFSFNKGPKEVKKWDNRKKIVSVTSLFRE